MLSENVLLLRVLADDFYSLIVWMTLFNRQFSWFEWLIGRLGPLVRLLGWVRRRLPIDFPCEVVLAVNVTVKHLYLLNADMFQ